MKNLLIGLLGLTSVSAFAGTCETRAHPRSDWAGTRSSVIYGPWVHRDMILDAVNSDFCQSAAVKELAIPFHTAAEEAPIENVKFSFSDSGITITGKVSRSE